MTPNTTTTKNGLIVTAPRTVSPEVARLLVPLFVVKKRKK